MARTVKKNKGEKRRRTSIESVERNAITTRPRSGLRSVVVPLLLIAIAILFVYSNAFNGPFVFDDEVSIEKNQSIRTLWPLSRSLWAPQDTPTAGRPAVNLTFALNYAWGRQEVLGYHLVNVLLHTFNAFLLFGLIHKSLENSPWQDWTSTFPMGFPFLIVLLWAVHPLHTETVNYVTQRTELLMAFFFLSTMLSARIAWDATRYWSRLAWTGVCVACCALGMTSKEVMVVAPVMVVLYDLAVMKQIPSSLMKSRGLFYASLASTWGILAALLTTNPRGESAGFGLSINPFDYLTTQFWAIAQYLRLSIWPVGLCGDYGVFRVLEIGIWIPYLLPISILIIATLWAWFHCRILSFLGLWFFLILSPSTSVVPIMTEPIAERRMYLSLAAVIVVVIVGVSYFAQWSSHWFEMKFSPRVSLPSNRQHTLVAIALLAIAATFAGISHARNGVYQNKIVYWKDVVQKKPKNARGYQNLGNAFLEAKQIELARTNYEQAKLLAPSDADSHYNMGVWQMNYGNSDEAIASFDRALSIKPRKYEAAYNLALLFYRLGRLDESIAGYTNAIRISPNSAAAHLNLGNVFFTAGRLDEALEMYQAAFRLNPQLSESYLNLGAVFARKGEYVLAIEWLEKAAKVSVDKPDVFSNLGYCFAALGRTEEAVAAYSKCVTLQPSDADAWYSLGKVHIVRGERVEARRCFERVMQLDPHAIEARDALQQLDLE